MKNKKKQQNDKNNLKIRIRQLIESKGALDKVLKCDKIPIKTAYMLSKFAKIMDQELMLFEEKRNELVKKYGKEKNGNWEVIPDNLQNFYDDINQLLDIEIIFPDTKVPLTDLTHCDLSSIDILYINYLIIPDEDYS